MCDAAAYRITIAGYDCVLATKEGGCLCWPRGQHTDDAHSCHRARAWLVRQLWHMHLSDRQGHGVTLSPAYL